MEKNIFQTSETDIVVLYLHKHRKNDLENWLKSLSRAANLNILLLVSNDTVNEVSPLLDTEHLFEIQNIQEIDSIYTSPKSKDSFLKLLFKEFSNAYRAFKCRYQNAYKLLIERKGAVLITYDDRMTSLLPILKASHKLNMMVFLPALLTTNPDINETTSNTLRKQRLIEKLLAKLVNLFKPTHVNNDKRLFYDAVSYLILLWFNALPKHPWVKGSSKFVNKVGVESYLAKTKMINAGLSESKISLTGLPIYDLMNFSRSKKDFSKPILLCALPQYGEHGAMNVEKALSVIEEIFSSFSSFPGRVIISLHPRMNPEDYLPIIDKFNFEGVVGEVDFWLRKATIFFSAPSSTTIYWALMMGVPTVALNHIFPKSDIFRNFNSITFIENNALIEIPEVIKNLKPNWEKLIKLDQEDLSMSLVTDGHCGLRNMAIINSLKNSKV